MSSLELKGTKMKFMELKQPSDFVIGENSASAVTIKAAYWSLGGADLTTR